MSIGKRAHTLSSPLAANRLLRRVLRWERVPDLLVRFRDDKAGNFVVIVALLLPVIIGCVGLGIDVGIWENNQQRMQKAADSAAISAAVAYTTNTTSDLDQQAKSVAGSYGFANGSSGTSISVNRPPSSGSYATTNNAVEVIIQQSQNLLFSAVLGSRQISATARAVAIGVSHSCVLALDSTASSAIGVQGSTAVTLNNCAMFSDSNSTSGVSAGGSSTISALSVGSVGGISGASNITAVQGLARNASAISDPYADVSVPAFYGCNATNYTSKTTETLDPGVYCGGLNLNAGANVTLNPGIYYMDRGSLNVAGGSTLTGSGVTIVFTSSTGSSYATAKIVGGAVINLSPPTSGPTAGIVLFGDRAMPVGTSFSLGGGASQTFAGATYLPKGAISFSGGASTYNGCSQVIADTINFVGNSGLAINCAGTGVRLIGASAQLAE
jgi:Flp pilus assembly protein TadG